MSECDCEYEIFATHDSTCPKYVYKYRLPCDGSNCDALYNEVCIERDELQAELDTAKKEIEKWKKHNRECMIARFSALGCTCGLF